MLKNNFFDYLKYEKRYSPHTIKAYSADLEDFSIFLKATYSTDDLLMVTPEMIRSWLVKLFELSISPRSINRKISSLKSFYRFCFKQGIIQTNPLLKVTSPKQLSSLPAFISGEKMSQLLSSGIFGSDFESTRDKLIITMLYATGIRRAELLSLKITDIDLSNLTIKVTGKRNKQRIIPIGNSLNKAIQDYILIRYNFLNKKTETDINIPNQVFVTSKAKPLSERQVYNIVHKYLTFISSNEKLSPHVLRHTFATQMLDNGADINAIKDILGHSSLAATQVYTHNTIEKLKKIHKQAHPRA